MNFYDLLLAKKLSGGGGGGNQNVIFIDNSTDFNLKSTTSNAIKEVIVPNSFTNIANNACSQYGNLEKITISNGITSIGQDAFYNCTKLESVYFSNTLTLIDTEAFQNCTALKEIDLPSTITTLNSKAFYGCTSLNKITVRAINPPSTTTNTFYNVPIDCPIYVPAESVETYKSSSYWRGRANYIQAIPT